MPFAAARARVRALLGTRRSRRTATVGAAAVVLLAGAAALRGAGLGPATPVVTLREGVRGARDPRRLVVFVKGGSADMRSYLPLLERLLREPELGGSDLLLVDHRVTRLTTTRAADVATRVRAEIDAQWIRAGGYADVILAGHSMGSLFVRQAYLASAGRDPVHPRTVPWADRVSRIVMLSGIGRGVDAEEHGAWRWVLAACRYVPLLRQSVMYDVLRGSAFVTNVRIQWIRHFAVPAAASGALPLVVQLLGTEDEVIRRGDNIDLEQFPTAFQIDVPGARHRTIQRLDDAPDPALRYRLFREAFTSRSFPSASHRRSIADSVERVVMLLHGLRSSRDGWVRELAPQLRDRMPRTLVVESSYGHVSMLGFALPGVRRRELRWLQDRYTELLARHPNAQFDVVAHSNGTYLLGESLTQVPAMHFERVLLLGSVLPADYPWRERFARDQVRAVRSDRAVDDAVVALWCSALHGIGMTDVGTSGWRGFDEASPGPVDVVWTSGGHSAALAPANLAALADYVASGRTSSVSAGDGAPSPGLARMSRVAPWLAWLAVVLAVGGGARILSARRQSPPRRIAALVALVLLVAAFADVF